LERTLADKLGRRVLESAQVAEEALALFDGSGNYGPSWMPEPWHPGTFALPLPQGACSDALAQRLLRIVKYNAHRWPGRDPTTGGPAPGLGLWHWPPMINHGVEADGKPNCAHILIGDGMAFRSTHPIKRGEEILDRYSTPLAQKFEDTLEVLREHDMEDPAYKVAAIRWGELAATDGVDDVAATHCDVGPTTLSEGRAELMEALRRIEGKVKASGSFHTTSRDDYFKLKVCYKRSATEALEDLTKPEKIRELLLAPPEIRCLNLLCPLGLRWEGRAACLEFRAELVRRVSAARPYHFSEVKLWAELFALFEELRDARVVLTTVESELAAEVTKELMRCGEFWLGRPGGGVQLQELREVLLPWARGAGGFRFGWFSGVRADTLVASGTH